MYRIVKRTLRTVTTVTWSIRWTDPDGRERAGEITLPAVHSIEEQDLSSARGLPERPLPSTNGAPSDLTQSKGE